MLSLRAVQELAGSRLWRVATPALIVATLAVWVASSATAEAAQPRPGAHYSDCTTARCSVGLAISPDGRFVRGFSVYARCTPAPPAVPRMRIASSGAFRYHGAMWVGRRQVVVEISARFVSRGVARGTVRYRRAGCDTGRLPFRATLD